MPFRFSLNDAFNIFGQQIPFAYQPATLGF